MQRTLQGLCWIEAILLCSNCRAAILLESRTFGVRSKWSKDPARRLWSASDESPGARAVWWKPRARAVWVKLRARAVCCGTWRGCTAFCCTCCQSGGSRGRTSGMLWDSTVPPTRATRNRELWRCLIEKPASSFYTWFPRKLNEMKRRSIVFCFEVLNLSFPVSPAGTKLIKWRQSAWFSWYPTAVTILLPEQLTHAAMQQESYFSMKSLEERFIALQKSGTEPFNVFAKCSQHSNAVDVSPWAGL